MDNFVLAIYAIIPHIRRVTGLFCPNRRRKVKRLVSTAQNHISMPKNVYNLASPGKAVRFDGIVISLPDVP